MTNNSNEGLLKRSFKEQQIILNDERHLSINEKVAYSVSKIMSWILFALLFITGAIMKDYTALFIVSMLTIIKLILTIIYSYYYSRKI